MDHDILSNFKSGLSAFHHLMKTREIKQSQSVIIFHFGLDSISDRGSSCHAILLFLIDYLEKQETVSNNVLLSGSANAVKTKLYFGLGFKSHPKSL